MLRTRIFVVLIVLIVYDINGVIAKPKNDLEEQIQNILDTSKPVVRRSVSSLTNNTQRCECVPYYLCNSKNQTITNGEGLIDKRSSIERRDYMKSCWSLEDHVNDTIVPQHRNTTLGCGYRRPDGIATERMGDTQGKAKFGEFPWMVALLTEELYDSGVGNTYKCGGSLIHPKVVLTAAYCICNTTAYKIRAGAWHSTVKNEILKHQDRAVESVIIHPDYYGPALFYDVALLILKNPVQLDQHISIACLARPLTAISAATECWATGWGKQRFGYKGGYSDILKKVDLPYVESDTCQNRLRSTRLWKYFHLHKSFVCAGGVAGKDVCQGDGGSPLVCPISGQAERYQQVGIVSWGINCGKDGIPGVYGNVALFREWIDSEMRKQNLDIAQYEY